LSLLLGGWAGLVHARSAVAAPGDPVATIRSFDRRLRHVLERRVPDWSPEADVAQIEIHALVDDTLSIPELARGTLGDHWSEATAQQRRAFLGLFRELLVKRIATGQLLAYAPESAPKLILSTDGVAGVGMVVHIAETGAQPARRTQVEYRLRYLAGKWRLVDLLVDDASVVRDYQTQFDRIIAREKFDGLLERMRKQLS